MSILSILEICSPNFKGSLWAVIAILMNEAVGRFAKRRYEGRTIPACPSAQVANVSKKSKKPVMNIVS